MKPSSHKRKTLQLLFKYQQCSAVLHLLEIFSPTNPSPSSVCMLPGKLSNPSYLKTTHIVAYLKFVKDSRQLYKHIWCMFVNIHSIYLVNTAGRLDKHEIWKNIISLFTLILFPLTNYAILLIKKFIREPTNNKRTLIYIKPSNLPQKKYKKQNNKSAIRLFMERNGISKQISI